METLYSRFKISAEKNLSRPAVYYKKEKRWRPLNYENFLDLVDRLAGGLAQLGIKECDRVAIFSENRYECLAVHLAANKLGLISVPIHATAREDLIKYVIENSGSGVLFVSGGLFEKYLDLFDELQKSLKIILFDSDCRKNENIVSWENMVNQSVIAEIKGDYSSLASIIYTSGTTGQPKGVMLSNKNFLADIDAGCAMIPVYNTDKFLSFLSMAHVLELTIGNFVPILNGASIAYAEAVKKVPDNLIEVKPTILISVPKIFEVFQEKIIDKIGKSPAVLKKFFFWSLNKKSGAVCKYIADKIFYHKIRKSFGGHLRFSICGGAGINERIIKFFSKVGIIIAEGYGLTETSPVIAVNPLEYRVFGTVGQPLRNLHVKIADDKEIKVRGDIVTAGYWQNKEKTQELFDEDGWMRTGDLGFLDKQGYLTIIGRKKDIIVTTNGKNIAPEKIEGILNLSPYIAQSLVVGHNKKFLSALIVPEKGVIEEKFGNKADIKKILGKEIEKINESLIHFERIRNFKIINNVFSMENDELTPTLKIKRKVVENKYKKEIEGLYL